MTDDKLNQDSLQDLGQRIDKLRQTQGLSSGQDDEAKGPDPVGLGIRLGAEMVAAVLVGASLGYGLDRLLGTLPLMMVLLLFLGGAAGVMNAWRVMQGLDSGVGLGRAMKAKQQTDDSGTTDGTR